MFCSVKDPFKRLKNQDADWEKKNCKPHVSRT